MFYKYHEPIQLFLMYLRGIEFKVALKFSFIDVTLNFKYINK